MAEVIKRAVVKTVNLRQMFTPAARDLPRGGAVYISFQEDGDDFKKLFDFYPDEVSFCQSEFIGLTEYEGREVFVKKDTRYLRSQFFFFPLSG